MDSLIKQPREVLDFSLGFADALNTGDTLKLTSPVVSIELLQGTGTLPAIDATTVNAVASAIKVRISGGEAGQVCLVTCLADTESGERLEGEFRLKVKEVR